MPSTEWMGLFPKKRTRKKRRMLLVDMQRGLHALKKRNRKVSQARRLTRERRKEARSAEGHTNSA